MRKRESRRLRPSRPQAPSLSSRSRSPSPSKAAVTLSELTPVQFFQKRFCELDEQLHRTRQLTAPEGSKKFFDEYQSFKGTLPAFAFHAARLLKQRILSAPWNPESFSYCQLFKTNFPVFIQSFTTFQNKLPSLYIQSLLGYYQQMQEHFEAIGRICYGDPQTRTVWLQYDESCRDCLSEIGKGIRSIFENDRFQTFSNTEAIDLSEKTKTLCRFLLIDFPRFLSAPAVAGTGI